MKRILVTGIVALVLLIVGCKQTDLPPDYVGTWSMANGNQLILNSNNTYLLTNTSILYAGTGIYSVKNTLVTITDKTGACGDSIVGTYTYKHFIDSNSGTFHEHLTINFVNDTCAIRAATLQGTYDKVVK